VTWERAIAALLGAAAIAGGYGTFEATSVCVDTLAPIIEVYAERETELRAELDECKGE
jgi:hypothetical protein